MPKMTTYTNASEEHVLDKSLTIVQQNIDIDIKADTGIINPTVIVSDSVGAGYNYVYIDVFDRYYYVKNITYSQQHFIVELNIDVLMSHNAAIKDLDLIANRSSSRFNVYQPDAQVSFLQKNIIATQKFPYGFNGQSLILAVNGG
jgi:hypothetical protein